jgi:chaperonin GroEL
MYFDRGFITTRFITDEPKQLAVLEKPYVFLFDGKLASMRSLLPLLEQVAKSGNSLLVVADDVEGEALETLLANHLRGTLHSIAVRSPGSQMRRALLEDIAVATGGIVVPGSTYAIENAFLGQLGRADKVEVSKDTTWIFGGRGKLDLIQSRAAGIRQQISVASADYEREKLRERLAKLVGRISAIRVGGASVVDRRERRYRVQSALHSAQLALVSGVLPGGGTALWRARGVVLQTGDNHGSKIIADALEVPLRVQLGNSRVAVSDVLTELTQSSDVSVGFNAETRRVSNLQDGGVLDATKVVVRGLQIAFAHARTVLQTGAWDISEHTRPPQVRIGPDEL